ncbi:MAG: hypothetical protein ABIY50_04365 [Ignavibacteria bacterium]
MKIEVTKCICYNTTFEEMKSIMQKNKLNTVDELRNIKPVALDCRLCLPYIIKMINTGETKFDLITN